MMVCSGGGHQHNLGPPSRVASVTIPRTDGGRGFVLSEGSKNDLGHELEAGASQPVEKSPLPHPRIGGARRPASVPEGAQMVPGRPPDRLPCGISQAKGPTNGLAPPPSEDLRLKAAGGGERGKGVRVRPRSLPPFPRSLKGAGRNRRWPDLCWAQDMFVTEIPW